MKKMTCRQLGGACDFEFQANTFEEIAELSKQHARMMVERGDKDHLEAMEYMRILMKSPEAMQSWYQSKREVFETL